MLALMNQPDRADRTLAALRAAGVGIGQVRPVAEPTYAPVHLAFTTSLSGATSHLYVLDAPDVYGTSVGDVRARYPDLWVVESADRRVIVALDPVWKSQGVEAAVRDTH
jgi:hypothetical protein